MGNQNSGRRPKPTVLKVLSGITRRDRLNPKEPQTPVGDVVKPQGLSLGASAVWDELAPVCMAMGTLTAADLRPFGTLCELQSTMQAVAKQKDGERFQAFKLESRDDDGDDREVVVVVDALLKVERETANGLRPYYEHFGMTPSSRARIQVPKKDEEPVSKWAGALK